MDVMYGVLVVLLTAFHLSVCQRFPRLHSVGTFNTLMIRNSPGFQERKDKLIETLADPQSKAPDVLCLQEIWRASDIKDVISATKEQYPYTASFVSDEPPSVQPACTAEEITALVTCITQSSCLSLQDQARAFQNCTLVECKDVFLQITDSCRVCVGTEPPGETLDDVFTACATVVPFSEYESPFGLLVLSRYRLIRVRTVDLHPNIPVIVPRGYITARIQALKYRILCTHLASSQSTLDYVGPPMFKSDQEQQLDEILSIHKIVENTGRNKIVLLGDFNHGPATPGLQWILPVNYGLMAARGLTSVNSLWCSLCTFCSSNVLTVEDEDSIVDHVYLPSSLVSAVVRTERLFDDIITPSGLPLSDHFGVKVEMWTVQYFVFNCPGSEVPSENVNLLPMDDFEDQLEPFCLPD